MPESAAWCWEKTLVVVSAHPVDEAVNNLIINQHSSKFILFPFNTFVDLK